MVLNEESPVRGPSVVRAKSKATKRSAPKPPLDNSIFNSIFLTQPP